MIKKEKDFIITNARSIPESKGAFFPPTRAYLCLKTKEFHYNQATEEIRKFENTKVQKYLMSSTDHDRMQAALKFKGKLAFSGLN